MITYTVAAENRVLDGEDPMVVYNMFSEPFRERKRMLRILKTALEQLDDQL